MHLFRQVFLVGMKSFKCVCSKALTAFISTIFFLMYQNNLSNSNQKIIPLWFNSKSKFLSTFIKIHIPHSFPKPNITVPWRSLSARWWLNQLWKMCFHYTSTLPWRAFSTFTSSSFSVLFVCEARRKISPRHIRIFDSGKHFVISFFPLFLSFSGECVCVSEYWLSFFVPFLNFMSLGRFSLF